MICFKIIIATQFGEFSRYYSSFFFFFFEIKDIHFIQCLLPASCRSHSSIFKKFSHYVSAAIDKKKCPLDFKVFLK